MGKIFKIYKVIKMKIHEEQSMVTSTSLQNIGYTQRQSYSIMNRLKKLNCNYRSIKTRRNYIRNGVICDLMYFCDAIDTKEAIEALRAYIANIPKEASLAKWEGIFNKLGGKR